MTTAAHDQPRKRRPLFGLRRQPGRLALGRHADATSALPPRLGQAARPHVPADHPPGPQERQAARDGRDGADATTRRLERPSSSRPGGRTPNGCGTCARILRCEIQIGRETYVPEQHFLSEDEAVAVAIEFRRRHPLRLRLFATILGWGDLSSDEAVREFVRTPTVCLVPPGERRPPRALQHTVRVPCPRHGGAGGRPRAPLRRAPRRARGPDSSSQRSRGRRRGRACRPRTRTGAGAPAARSTSTRRRPRTASGRSATGPGSGPRRWPGTGGPTAVDPLDRLPSVFEELDDDAAAMKILIDCRA